MKVLRKPKIKENDMGFVCVCVCLFVCLRGKNAQVHKSVNGQKTTKWKIQEICQTKSAHWMGMCMST